MPRPAGNEGSPGIAARGSEAHPAPAPVGASIPALEAVARTCQACPLWRRATQTVFGEGPRRASLMFVGEQPGDQEDRQGRPFVGPAGRLLDRALEELGVDRRSVYVTNAVKHFKWAASADRGKRRIHEKPNAIEISACRPWLLAEIAALRPKVIVLLGATAAQALMGRAFRVTQHRGHLLPLPPIEGLPPSITAQVLPTVHPSSILRARDDDNRHRELRQFITDLRPAAAILVPH